MNRMFNSINLFDNAINRFKENELLDLVLSTNTSLNIPLDNLKMNERFIFHTNAKKNEILDKYFPSYYLNDEHTSGVAFIRYFVDENKPVKYKTDTIFNKGYEKIFHLKKLKDFFEIDNLYGILARISGTFVNITHPLILIDFLYGDSKMSDIEFLLIYADNSTTNESYTETEADDLKSKIREVMNGYILQYYIEHLEKKDKAEKQIEKDKIIYLYSTNQEDTIYQDTDETKVVDEQKFFIPVDKLVYNHFVPYYGWIFAYIGKGDLQGINLFTNDNLSCNIQNTSEAKAFSHCCTGNYKYNSYQGLDTMKCANLASPYTSYCVSKKYKSWANINISIAKDMLNKFIKDNSND